MWQLRTILTTSVALVGIISARPPSIVDRRNTRVQAASFTLEGDSVLPIHLHARAFAEKQEDVHFLAPGDVSPATMATSPRQLYKAHSLAARAPGFGEGSSSAQASGSGQGCKKSKTSKKGHMFLMKGGRRPWLPSTTASSGGPPRSSSPAPPSTPLAMPQSARSEKVQAWLQKKKLRQSASRGQDATRPFLGGQPDQQTTRALSNLEPRPHTTVALTKVDSRINVPTTSHHAGDPPCAQSVKMHIDKGPQTKPSPPLEVLDEARFHFFSNHYDGWWT